MSELLEKIRESGHWRVVIRPACFEEDRISSISELYPLLERTTVRLRGRAFPIVRDEQPTFFEGHIGYEEDEKFAEFWRFYQSGQFIQYTGFIEDRLDSSRIESLPSDWKPGLFLDPVQVLFRSTEIFEFATRLSFTAAANHQTHMELSVNGIKGRSLKSASGKLVALPGNCCQDENFSVAYDFSNIQLVANNRDLALQAAHEVFSCFGWKPSTSLLRDFQADLIENSPWVANVR